MEKTIPYKNHVISVEVHEDVDALLPYHCSVTVQKNFGDTDIQTFSSKPSRATEKEAIEAGLFAGRYFVDQKPEAS